MSLTSEGMTPADIAAVTGNRSNGGFGYSGDGLWYLIILFLFMGAFNGGWGNNGNGGGMYGGGYGLYPWMNQSQQINDGFRDQMISGNINAIRDAVFSISTQLCNGFSSVTAAVNNGFAQAEIAANGRQMANMQQLFGLSQQFSDCCCEQRLGNCQTQNIIQNEGNATRYANAQNTRDIIDAVNSKVQGIYDKLCQLELDGVKQENANLRTQLNMANLAASQTAQTADLRQSNAAQLNQLVNELRSCPIPAQPVYGSQPIFTCNGNQGCGCGNGFYN